MIVGHDRRRALGDPEPRPDLAQAAAPERAGVSRRTWTTRFRTTCTATSRTGRRTGGRATAGSTRAVVDDGGGGRGGFRAACGMPLAAAKAAGRSPIRSIQTSSGRPRPAPAVVGGIVVRYDERTAAVAERGGVAGPAERRPGRDLKYRFIWNAPVRTSRRTITTRSTPAASTCTASTDGGQSWQEISPDLTLNDKSRQQKMSGGLTPDNIGVEYARRRLRDRGVAQGRRALIWAGTNDGLVQVTRDGGKHVDQRHRRTFPTFRPGARSATSSRRASTRARRTSPSISTR